jgi:chromosome segregation ATPase
MNSILMIFIACVILVALAIWVYNDKDKTAGDQAVAQVRLLNTEIRSVKKDLNDLKSVASSNITTIMNQAAKIEALSAQVVNMKDEIQIFRDQVSETREKQIQLRDDLSKKRPVLRAPQGPIQIEILTPSKKAPPPKPGKGINSLIRERQAQ